MSTTATDNRKYRYGPQNRKELHLWNCDRERLNSNAKFGIFDDDELDKKISQMIGTTIDYQKLQDWCPKRLFCHFWLSVVVAITWSFFELGVVENPRFAVGIVILSVIVPEI